MLQKTADLRLSLSRRFTQPAERVFDAWLTPSVARHFLFARPGGQNVRSEIDARVGGRFVLANRREGDEVEHVGEFRVIERPRRLVFDVGVPAFSPEVDTASILISRLPSGSGCALALSLELRPESATQLDQALEGWTKVLENLAKALR